MCGTVFDALKPKAYFVIGVLFPHDKADMDHFRERSTPLNELDEGGSGRWHYQNKGLQQSVKLSGAYIHRHVTPEPFVELRGSDS